MTKKRQRPARAAAAPPPRPRQQPSPASSDDDELPAALAAYGERFMAMFDDADDLPPPKQRRKQPAAAPRGRSSEPSSSSGEPCSSDSAAGADSSSSSGEEGGSSDAEGRAASHAHAGPSTPRGDGQLEAFLSGRKGSSRGAKAARPASRAQLQEQQRRREQQRLLEAQLKKQFMSPKAGNIFRDVDAGQLAAAAAPPADEGVTPAAFAQMRRDVELLGASALDKRAAKAWKASQLAKLGAAAERRQRMPASIGHGMARKAKQREVAALAEAVAAGMVQAKGRGKKLRAQKAKQRDRGLMEAGPGFRNGVLRLPKPARPRA